MTIPTSRRSSGTTGRRWRQIRAARYAVSGKRDRARRAMEELTRTAKTRHVSPHHMALIQAGLGNKSEALALLEMSYEKHEAPLALLRVDPRWDPLRGDARFGRLLHELSLDK